MFKFNKLSHQEKLARRDEKQAAILKFLASGEVFTTSEVVSDLLGISGRNAARALEGLEKAMAVKSEMHLVNSRKIKIFGLTPHGAALAGVFDAPIFELGRANPSWIPHRLELQKLHIRAERHGWTGWTPERQLMGLGLKKVPDAGVIDPAGNRVAVEFERYCKTKKRYGEIIVSYLQMFKSGHFFEVHYITPDGLEHLIKRAFTEIKTLRFAGENVEFTEKHRERFHFYSFSDWLMEGENNG